jgi:hypothetical protein
MRPALDKWREESMAALEKRFSDLADELLAEGLHKHLAGDDRLAQYEPTDAITVAMIRSLYRRLGSGEAVHGWIEYVEDKYFGEAQQGKPSDDDAETRRRARAYRGAQMQKMLDLFAEATGKPAGNMPEVYAWVDSPEGKAVLRRHSDADGQIIPDLPRR